MSGPTPAQARVILRKLRGRGLSEQHFQRIHHRARATRDAHDAYLRTIDSYAGPDATNLRLAQRMAYILERLPEDGRFVEAHVFDRLVSEALRAYPK